MEDPVACLEAPRPKGNCDVAGYPITTFQLVLLRAIGSRHYFWVHNSICIVCTIAQIGVAVFWRLWPCRSVIS